MYIFWRRGVVVTLTPHFIQQGQNVDSTQFQIQKQPPEVLYKRSCSEEAGRVVSELWNVHENLWRWFGSK